MSTPTDGVGSSHPYRGYALAVLAAACWATGGLTAKWLFTAPSVATATWPVQPTGIAISPAALSAGRALSAFLLLALYLLITDRGALKISRSQLPFLAVFGIAGLAGVHFTYFKAISLTNVATAILLEYLAPVIVLLVSVIFLHHRFTWALPIGVGLSVTGCALVVGALGGGGLVVTPLGIAWGLASAVLFATYSLLGSVAVGRFRASTLLVWGLGFATAFWLVVLGPSAVISVFESPLSALAICYVAVVSTIIPFGAFLTALHYIAPTNATVTATIEPVLAAIGAYFLFGEVLTAPQILGGLLVIAAIVVVQLPDRTQPLPELPPGS